jgi:N6-L-threonylcarbamoyladenine synthase
MRILAIETSCDDTTVAIVEGIKEKVRVLTSRVWSQERLHASFGGVVPEVASREHLKAIYPLIDEALSDCKLRPKDIDAIAVTTGPGLLGSLVVGINAAKTLAYLWKKPLVSVDHLRGHLYAGFLTDAKVKFPIIGLLASGGHTEWVLTKKHGDYKRLGGTLDDAAGEAFDKVARILGLGYPGGPAIASVAEKTIKPSKIKLPRPMLDKSKLDVSFSGLKTAVLYAVRKANKDELAREFQQAVVDTLVAKTKLAVAKYKPATVVLGGGVASNKVLRAELKEALSGVNTRLVVAEPKYCTDNAAMIAAAAYFNYQRGKGYEWYNARVNF